MACLAQREAKGTRNRGMKGKKNNFQLKNFVFSYKTVLNLNKKARHTMSLHSTFFYRIYGAKYNNINILPLIIDKKVHFFAFLELIKRYTSK
jgi:hypothetical protein